MAVWVSKSVVYNKDLIDAVASAMKTVPGGALMLGAKMHLFKNNFAPSPTTVVAGFTVADFSGYTAPAITLTGPANLNIGQSAMLANALFLATTASPFVPNTLYGWFLTDATAAAWYACERFTNPIAISSAADFVDLAVGFPFSYNQIVFP